MRRFKLVRNEDATGISGTGVVAEGVLSSTGKIALFWLTEWRSIVIYDSMEHLINIHGHNGKTVVEWIGIDG